MKLLSIILLLCICACSSADGQERPRTPLYGFDCRHEAVLCAIAIEPYCGPLPVIHTGSGHAEAFCPDLGYVRMVGTRAVGVYPVPGVEMVVEEIFTVNEYLTYVFGWTLE